jgi:DNA-binding MurR/RpiR family transcriptional regulator
MAERLAAVTRPAERTVADYLLGAGVRAATMSARDIAAAVGTSAATVVRTAHSLGYANLRELREALAGGDEGTDIAGRLDATLAGAPDSHALLARVAETQLAALDQLLRGVPAQQFDAATALLAAAPRVWWSGIGPSASIATYGAFLCRRLGTPSGALTHAGRDLADELLAIEPHDAVVVLAYGRTHPTASVVMKRAAQVDAPTVLVTDTNAGARARAATVVLAAGRGTPQLFATHVPTVVLVEALVLAIAAQDRRRATRSLATLDNLRRALGAAPARRA